MNDGSTRIYISAGEPSGDIHAAPVVSDLKLRSSCDVFGMGGPRMERAGARLTQTIDRMSTIGFGEVLRSMPRHVRQFAITRSAIRQNPPGLAVLVDYPGYHLRLAAAASQARVPVLYYIAPQLWAWGERRIKAMRKSVSHIAAILPFERDFFSRRGIPTTFVGHPLLDRGPVPTRAAARKRIGLGDTEPVLALFPGSRTIEIGRHWPVFREVARRLTQSIPGLRTIVAVSANRDLPEMHECLSVNDDSLNALAAADVVLGKSGTTTLEAAFVGRPMCIAYKTSAVNFQIAKRVITCDHIGLVNLLLGRRAIPEYVQSNANPVNLVNALLPLFDADGLAVKQQLQAMNEARDSMGTPGAAARVGDLVMELAA